MKSYSLIELLDSICQRPGMYIGEPSLEKLSCFIYGYKKAMHDLGVEETPEINFTEFSDWARKKYDYPGSAVTAGWDKSIYAISMGVSSKDLDWCNLPEAEFDEHQKSIELFVNLVKQYVSNEST